jgi:hypothetical protein
MHKIEAIKAFRKILAPLGVCSFEIDNDPTIQGMRVFHCEDWGDFGYTMISAYVDEIEGTIRFKISDHAYTGGSTFHLDAGARLNLDGVIFDRLADVEKTVQAILEFKADCRARG